MVTLLNPLNGADIKSVYVEKGKEIYQDAVEINNGLEIKVKKIVNAQPFELKKGEKIELPEHQAEWALHLWGFLQKVAAVSDPIPTKVELVETIQENPIIEAVEVKDDSDRFAELQIRGFANLKAPERKEYQTLKARLLNN